MPQHAPTRQSLLFIATWLKDVQALARKTVPNATHITLGSFELSANASIMQHIIKMEQLQKILPKLRQDEC
jgi:superfamily II DNA/RNA helicase